MENNQKNHFENIPDKLKTFAEFVRVVGIVIMVISVIVAFIMGVDGVFDVFGSICVGIAGVVVGVFVWYSSFAVYGYSEIVDCAEQHNEKVTTENAAAEKVAETTADTAPENETK